MYKWATCLSDYLLFMWKKWKVVVNTDGCIGCGACMAICPKVFKYNDDFKSYVVAQPENESDRQDVQSCIDTCPVEVIYTEWD